MLMMMITMITVMPSTFEVATRRWPSQPSSNKLLENRTQRLEDRITAKDVLIEEQSQVITQLMELSWLPGRKFNSCASINDYNNNNSRNINSTIRS